MKYIKMLGLLAVAAAALMAFVGSASAATLTSPTGTVYSGTIEATSEHTQLHGSVELTCTHSLVKGEITKPHHVEGKITSLTFSGCGPDTVAPVSGKLGKLTIDGSGAVTSIETQVTALIHRTIFGFPITTHCIYDTGLGTSIGTLDDSHKTKTSAILTIGSSAIPQVSTDGSCGSNAVWTGSYTITKPHELFLDA